MTAASNTGDTAPIAQEAARASYEPEPKGLFALMLYCTARGPARRGGHLLRR